MNSLKTRFSTKAQSVKLTEDDLIVTLQDTRVISVPLYYFPRLLHATKEQRNSFEISSRGTGIHWESIDEDISVAGLLGLPD